MARLGMDGTGKVDRLRAHRTTVTNVLYQGKYFTYFTYVPEQVLGPVSLVSPREMEAVGV